MEIYQQLEQDFGQWVGLDNVVACSSGTAALHLALEAFQFPPGSEVIVPDFTMIACARAVTLAGLKPVFVDCGEDLLMDMAKAEKAITDKTVAVMLVHIYGRVCDVEAIDDIVANKNIKIIEDCAECPLSIPDAASDAYCWSFYHNKVIAGEEGGAVAFPLGERLAERARQLRSLGFTEAHDFNHVPRGHNYRLANCLAEKILKSLERVDQNIEDRREVEKIFDLYCPAEWKMPKRDVPWVYDMRVPADLRDRMVARLKEKRIQARHGFKTMSSQVEYYKPNVHNPVAEKAADEILYLPIGIPGLNVEYYGFWAEWMLGVTKGIREGR